MCFGTQPRYAAPENSASNNKIPLRRFHRILTKNYGAEFVRFLAPASRASVWARVEKFWHNGSDTSN